MTQILIKIVLLAACLASLFTAHIYDKHIAVKASYAQAKNDAQVEYLQGDIQALTTVIVNTQHLIDHANAISQQIEIALAQRESANQKTTQELHHALALSAAKRIDCQFDAGVMQQITAARDRANRAAATGFGDALPTGTGTD